MQIWPGTAYPLGATYDGSGTNFALFSEVAEQVELCLFDADGTETRVELPEMDGFVWHAFLPGVEPGQRYGYRVHGPYDPDQGPALQPEQAAARPVRQGDRRHDRLGRVAVRLPLRRPGQPQRRRLGRRTCPSASSSTRSSTGASTGRRSTPYADTVIYEAHVKGMTADRTRRSPRSCAAPTPASRTRRSSSTCTQLGVTAIELMPVHHFVNDSTLIDKGLANYWGYNTIGFFAPDHKYSVEHQPGRAGAGVQGDGARPARGGHRGHPRRRLQPHRRGQPPRPDAVVPRHRQRGVLPARRGRPAVLHGLHRHREHAQRPAPALAAADHGLAALLGHRDARRRLPLRPRRRPWPASSTTSTGCRPSSTSCSRTRSSARSS